MKCDILEQVLYVLFVSEFFTLTWSTSGKQNLRMVLQKRVIHY